MTDQMTEEEWLAPADSRVLVTFVADRNAPSGAVVPEVFISERKLRLYLVACCRARWELITHPECRNAIEVAERFADGQADELARAACETSVDAITEAAREWMHAADAEQQAMKVRYHTSAAVAATCWLFNKLIAQQMYWGRSHDYVPFHPGNRLLQADETLRGVACALAEHIAATHGDEAPDWVTLVNGEYERQAELLRDIVGNPFRPVALTPAWLTSDVLALARGIYEERAFERMPILADALQDAGCDNPDVLNHCRDEKAGGGSGEPAGGASAQGVHVRGCWVVDLLLGLS